ncbi:hypothetical protein PPSIR1_41199 [Plesiocystis pacifica SIR-1]|uniref:Lipoprotein n=1 Tax=Plesiocystis pacifica SIR-1 TaxID=391625 RepID=A6GFR7_9BACT|nr:hypothetical protein [Plesiocystis pacifica]EDM75264.1 hypothetical protein PPSIR1_41199 [Plesiocystis pacifica SIR-1]
MRKQFLTLTCGALLGITACGDDGTGSDSVGDDEIGNTLGESAESESAEDQGEQGEQGEQDGSSSTTADTETSTDTESSSTDTESSSTDTETDSTSTETTDTESSSEESTETGDPCENLGELGPVEKLIWIANSGQGTVSKIDTETGTELGRYIVRADSAGSPSRTSVNRFGDVAVANRTGGIAKVYSSVEDCQDTNGTPGIQTSMGGTDILPWGEEECLAWFTEIPHEDNRPMAWTNGVFNEETCEWEGVDVWTAWSDWAAGTAVVALLDGDTGEIIQEVPIPDLPQPWPGWHGFYGAAVDADNNVWLSQLQGANPSPSWLVKVDRQTFEYTGYPVPEEGGYGMTVTSEGYVWICGRSTRRFDPATEQWTSVPLLGGGVHTGGCMGDGEGILYRGAYSQIYGIDTQTMETVKILDVAQPGDDFIWGVAVDFDGYVWGVPRNSSRAYKVDSDTNQIVTTVEGLVSAYTYSDMTGFALVNVDPA